jgi:hypothetical protein
VRQAEPVARELGAPQVAEASVVQALGQGLSAVELDQEAVALEPT